MFVYTMKSKRKTELHKSLNIFEKRNYSDFIVVSFLHKCFLFDKEFYVFLVLPESS